MAEMQDSLMQIQSDYLAGSFASEEEYQNAVAESKAYYFEKLQGYADLYNTALSADSSIAAEAWSTNFSTMFQSTQELEGAITSYMTGAEAAFEKWSGVIATVEETTGADLTSLANKVKSVTDQSDALMTSLTGDDGLIDSLTDGFDKVATAIENVIKELSGLPGLDTEDDDDDKDSNNNSNDAENNDSTSSDNTQVPPGDVTPSPDTTVTPESTPSTNILSDVLNAVGNIGAFATEIANAT
jgi:hypothetical protein